jgi:hypothetical protein
MIIKVQETHLSAMLRIICCQCFMHEALGKSVVGDLLPDSCLAKIKMLLFNRFYRLEAFSNRVGEMFHMWSKVSFHSCRGTQRPLEIDNYRSIGLLAGHFGK